MKDSIYEGYDENNVSKFYHFLVNRLYHNDILNKDLLFEYDQNIYSHTKRISEKRDVSIKWKYFQYLSLLFTEIYLDKYFTGQQKLLEDLNLFVKKFNEGNKVVYRGVEIENDAGFEAEPFVLEDLNKLAFWNATGSGKTLLMHVNILQFLSYYKKTRQRKPLNRIILLTPNEGLSRQHLKEFKESNLEAEIFSKEGKTLFSGHNIEIIDIHKLEDQSGDKTVAVDSFEGNNLVLVDEGHRGSSGKEWKVKRDKLSDAGFSYEYSATFGQAVSSASGANKNTLLREYSKCTLFDYSYKFFYNDGYGKDYRILNINDVSYESYTEKYLTACLLVYYQQLLIFRENKTKLSLFHLDKPLWIFVGGKVTAVRTENKKNVSDVVQILMFIADFVKNEQKSMDIINLLITGRHGLLNENNQDIFSNSFDYIIGTGLNAESIYRGILENLFNSEISGALLHLDNLKGSDGEIGLRIGNSDHFGVINVGDDKKLLDLCAENGMNTYEKDFSNSLFHNINEKDSKINILIGSKKFTEGWSSWRVSTMGLMNIGRGEGSEIIQLFGRGVRLKGYQYSLKRSGGLDQYLRPETIPTFLKKLETLNIFGIRADYMQQFKEYLEEEGLPSNDETMVKISVPVLPTINLDKKKLKVVQVEDNVNFKKQNIISLPLPEEFKGNTKVVIDWYPKVQIKESVKAGSMAAPSSRTKGILEDKHFSFINWDNVYFEIQKFKNERTWYNFSIDKYRLQEIIQRTDWYELYIPVDELELNDFTKVFTFQDIIVALLKGYCDKVYNFEKAKFLSNHLKVIELDSTHPNFIEEYNFQIEQSQTQIINKLRELSQKMRDDDFKDTLNIWLDFDAFEFSQHLYKPLIWFYQTRLQDFVKVSPVQLNDGEKDFVNDLKMFYKSNPEFFASKEMYLLRNSSRKGIGFFETKNFYPDFILWILEKEKQYIGFIDPKGLRQVNGVENEKIQLHKTIKTEIEAKLNDNTISLSSYIISNTPFNQLKHWKGQESIDDFWEYNVCFQKEQKEWYIKMILKRMLISESSVPN